MKLSSQQVAAAKARGFVLFPASQSQIERMTMQRRIFEVDGKPHVVSRDGVYYETHATLAPAIAGVAVPATPEPEPEPSAPSEAAPAASEAAATSEAEAAAAAAPAEAAPVSGALRLTRRRPAPPAEGGEEAPRRAPRRRAAPAEAAPEAEGEAAPPETEAEGAEGEAAAGEPGRRRLRLAEPPRWQVAGAKRRGREPRGQ